MDAMVPTVCLTLFPGYYRADDFLVGPELVKQADRFHRQDHHWRKTDDGQP